MNVAIVNDSKMAAEVLRRILAGLPEFKLVWIAYSGEQALELCARERPDIVLMDLIMPGIDGAETTRRIMQQCPCVVLVVTATTVGNRDMVFEAMGHGALDAVNTPVMAGDTLQGAEALIQKLRTVARLVSPPAARRRNPHPVRMPAQVPDTSAVPVLAIGASTGGPQAVATILLHLPAHLHAAVLVVQHVDEQFTPGLAAWLKHHSSIPVRIARSGERLSPGNVWIAGTREHLLYDSGFARYTADPAESAHSPSIDMLFTSLAQPHLAPRVGVLLTGMGRDGAEGLLAMRNAGAYTIAQDEASSVVYGMPRAAAELQAAQEILPLDAIAARVCQLLSYTEASATRKAGTR